MPSARKKRRTAGAGGILPFALALFVTAAAGSAWAAASPRRAPSELLFVTELMLLMLVGRLLGEAMLRLRQPAVMGQLIAGLLLGPSVLGALFPAVQHALFPPPPSRRR